MNVLMVINSLNIPAAQGKNPCITHYSNAVIISFKVTGSTCLLKFSLDVVCKGPSLHAKEKHLLPSISSSPLITAASSHWIIRYLVTQRLSLGYFVLDGQLSGGVYPGRLQPVSPCLTCPSRSAVMKQSHVSSWSAADSGTLLFLFFFYRLAEGLLLFRPYWTLQYC